MSRAIDWWNTCIRLHQEKLCLYGPTPPGLPQLDTDNCILNRTKTWQYTSSGKSKWCHDFFLWMNNSADRLRVGLYEHFITDWLKVFPRKQMLFIRFEDYVRDTLNVIQNQIYPFLDIPKLPENIAADIEKKLRKHKGTNRASKELNVTQETKDMLHRFYYPYNVKLRDLLKDNKWLWNSTGV